MRGIAICPWLALWAGCSSTVLVSERDPFADEDKGSASGLLSVSLRVLVPGEQGERLLIGDEPLHSGDRLAFVVRTNQDAYVHAVLRSSSGKSDVLFPDEKFNQISGRCAVRIPSRGWLRMSRQVGLENVRVVASATPLTQADPRLCQTLQLSCEANAPPAQPSPCSPQSALSQSGRRTVNPLVKRGLDDGSGVASVSVALQHLP